MPGGDEDHLARTGADVFVAHRAAALAADRDHHDRKRMDHGLAAGVDTIALLQARPDRAQVGLVEAFWPTNPGEALCAAFDMEGSAPR